jgi:hypothetical protein
MKPQITKKWISNIIKFGHPLVWDVCFTLYQKGELKMLDVISKNLPALIVITILGYIITFYFIQIDKIRRQHKKDYLIQKCNEIRNAIYLKLILRVMKNFSKDDLSYYDITSNYIDKNELKFIGFGDEETAKKRLMYFKGFEELGLNKLNIEFSKEELNSLGFTKEEINYIQNEHNNTK